MIAPRARSANVRSLIGLGVVAGVLTIVVAVVPRPDEPGVPPARSATAGMTLVTTVRVADGNTLRLWVSSTSVYVEDVHRNGVGTGGGTPAVNSASAILGGILGRVATPAAAAVEVRVPGGLVLRAPVGHGSYLLPDASETTLFVTPLDAQGRPLGAETEVTVEGRP